MNRRKFVKNVGAIALGSVVSSSVLGSIKSHDTSKMVKNANIRELLLEIQNNLNDERYIRGFNAMNQYSIECHYDFVTREIYHQKYGEHIRVYPKENFKGRWADSENYNEKMGAWIIVHDENYNEKMGAWIIVHDKNNNKEYLVNQKIIKASGSEYSGFRVIYHEGDNIDRYIKEINPCIVPNNMSYGWLI